MIFDTLNAEQRAAVLGMKDFIFGREGQSMVLEGAAGTGKTYCMKALIEVVRKSIVFTAPTNKAVKVLRETLTNEDYKPKCKTIYSLLGLVLAANGEVKELQEPEDPIDLSDCSVVIVDEGSMINDVLQRCIRKAQAQYPHLKWIFMGDRDQLPPIGMALSPIWEIPDIFKIKTIMRHDNSIVQLSIQLRSLIHTPMRALTLAKTSDITPLEYREFQLHMQENAAMFLSGRAKAISWRNARVDELNKMIRRQLFADQDLYPWQPGDRITTLEPVKDQTEGQDKRFTLANTDDEGVVEKADLAEHPLYPEFQCWRILMRKDDNQMVVLWALSLRDIGRHTRKIAEMAADAKRNHKLWGAFWEFKDAFSKVRHAYAITAHKSQGSTYERAYVNWRDIMLNKDRVEAYKCLYVACTRPKKELYLG